MLSVRSATTLIFLPLARVFSKVMSGALTPGSSAMVAGVVLTSSPSLAFTAAMKAL